MKHPHHVWHHCIKKPVIKVTAIVEPCKPVVKVIVEPCKPVVHCVTQAAHHCWHLTRCLPKCLQGAGGNVA